MFKCRIVLDEEKVINEGIYDVNELKENLNSICISENLYEEESNFYVQDGTRSSIGARMLLLSKLEKNNILLLIGYAPINGAETTEISILFFLNPLIKRS